MTTEKLYPDGIIEQTNYYGTLSDLQDEPYASDGSPNTDDQSCWNTVRPDAVGVAHLSFPLPSQGLKPGSGLQKFIVGTSGKGFSSSNPSLYIRLYENGVELASGSYAIDRISRDVVEFSFDASLLSDKSGAGLEIYIETYYAKYIDFSGQVTYLPVSLYAVQFIGTLEDVSQAPPPIVTVSNVDRSTISDEQGFQNSTITFSFDQDVTEWTVNVLGTSPTTGTIAASGGAVTAGTDINAIVDYMELYQEGDNRVNIYGKNSDGVWTEYGS